MLNLFSVPGWMVKHFCFNFQKTLPRACLSSILVVEPYKTRSFPIKTRVIWVPGKNIKESRPLPRISLFMVSIFTSPSHRLIGLDRGNPGFLGDTKGSSGKDTTQKNECPLKKGANAQKVKKRIVFQTHSFSGDMLAVLFSGANG